MPNINYAELFADNIVGEYKTGLRFGDLYTTPMNDEFTWTGAKTIHVPDLIVGGAVDTNRDAITAYTRDVDNEWQEITLEFDREFSTLVDPMDIDETNEVLSVANIASKFASFQQFPEMDAYMASKLYSRYVALGGNVNTTVPTAANMQDLLDNFTVDMNEAEVTDSGRILYVTPPIYKLITKMDSFDRNINVNANTGEIDTDIGFYNNIMVKQVPSSRMKSAYVFTKGFAPAASAVQMNMVMIHPTSIVSPVKYTDVRIGEPKAETKGKYLFFTRRYQTVEILNKRVDAIKINAES